MLKVHIYARLGMGPRLSQQQLFGMNINTFFLLRQMVFVPTYLVPSRQL